MVRPRRLPLGRVRDAALTRLEYVRRVRPGSAGLRVVAVVGMHRSGTSAVAGTLQEAGLYLGNVLRKHDSNPKGMREHIEIVKLHDAILAHSGGSWRAPSARIEWTDEHRDRRDRIVSSFAAAGLWGFKDPRAVLLLDFWREKLQGSLQLVGVFRNPAVVVASLLQRDGGGSGEWFALWERYNEQLLREHEAAQFPLVEFTSDVAEYRQQVVPVLRSLQLRVPTRLHFFDGNLGTARACASTAEMPGNAARVYESLRSARNSS